jgi:hypothetical protein
VNPVTLNPDLPLEPDWYTLTIGGGVEAVDSGMTLDGEVADPTDPASLPSGEGEPGGDAVIRFRVVRTIPTVSEWGLAILGLSLMCAGAIVLAGRPAVYQTAE